MLWIMTTCGQDDDVVLQGLEMTSIRMTWWTAPRMTWWTTAASGGWLCRARVGGPLPGPKTTEGIREFSRQPDL